MKHKIINRQMSFCRAFLEIQSRKISPRERSGKIAEFFNDKKAFMYQLQRASTQVRFLDLPVLTRAGASSSVPRVTSDARGSRGQRIFRHRFPRSTSLCSAYLGQSATVLLPQIHHQQFRFSHFFDRIAQAFTPQSGIFDSSVGHVIDAEGRNVAGDEASHFEFVVGLKQ